MASREHDHCDDCGQGDTATAAYHLALPESPFDEMRLTAAVCDIAIPKPYGMVFYYTEPGKHKVKPASNYHAHEGFPIAGIYQGALPIVPGELFWLVGIGPACLSRSEHAEAVAGSPNNTMMDASRSRSS